MLTRRDHFKARIIGDGSLKSILHEVSLPFPKMTQSFSDMEKASAVQAKTKKFVQNWLLWLCVSAALFGSAVFVIFSWTNVFANAILSNLVLRNGSQMFHFWLEPPVHLTYNIYIFNYTNIHDFSTGKADKLKVEEVGPFIYRELMSRVNPTFHDNGTIEYQEYRRYEYVGGRPETDVLTVPNVPLFMYMAGLRSLSNAPVNLVSRAFSFFGTNVGSLVLGFLQYEPFINLTAGEFLWGYDDDIISVIKQFDSHNQLMPFDKFGMLAAKVGLSKERFTVGSGEGGLEDLGLIQQINGVDSFDVWGDKVCDKITGTDGSMFPPHLVKNPDQALSVYSIDMCRAVPLEFERKSFSKGMPTLRYTVPKNLFNTTCAENQCFCSNATNDSEDGQKACPPSGTFNSSVCIYSLHGINVPLLTSYPHFYLGEDSLLERIEGLKPNRSLHESYIELHPRLAIPVGGWSRLQINLETRRTKNDPCPSNLKDGTILPTIWIEAGPEEFPDDLLTLMRHTIYTVGYVEAGLQLGSFLVTLISCLAIIHVLKGRYLKKPKTLLRNTSGQNPLLPA